MKHIKPKGYHETRPSGDGVHTYAVIISEKRQYCKHQSCCEHCDKKVRRGCEKIRRIEERQNQIIADKQLNKE
jgi:hypothetical protein